MTLKGHQFRRKGESDAERHRARLTDWYLKNVPVPELIQRAGVSTRTAAGGTVEEVHIPLSPHLADYRFALRNAADQGAGQSKSLADKIPRGKAREMAREDAGLPDSSQSADPAGSESGGEQAGKEPGRDNVRQPILTVNVEELLWRMFIEQYDLPFLEEIGSRRVSETSVAYLPEEHREWPERFLPLETFRAFLQRMAAEHVESRKGDRAEEGEDAENGVGIPPDLAFHPSDIRVRTAVDEPDEGTEVVLALVMDRTGSMQGDKLNNAKSFALFLALYLRRRYGKEAITLALVQHDVVARRIPQEREDEFWNVGASGGTICSTGWELVSNIIETEHPRANVYLAVMSDGISAGQDDNRKCTDIAMDLIDRGLVRRVMYVEARRPEDSSDPSAHYQAYQHHDRLGTSPRFLQGTLKRDDDLKRLLQAFCRVEEAEVDA